MACNPNYKWINPTYPIYNWGYNPLTKWDEPPSRHLKTHYQPQHLLSLSVFYLLLFTSFICLTYSACCKKLTCGVTWPFVFQMAVCGNLNELYSWLVVWNMFYFPFHIWDVILPIDELIFFKMVKNHQPVMIFACFQNLLVWKLAYRSSRKLGGNSNELYIYILYRYDMYNIPTALSHNIDQRTAGASWIR